MIPLAPPISYHAVSRVIFADYYKTRSFAPVQLYVAGCRTGSKPGTIMFPLQRGRMLVELSKRKTSTPIHHRREKKPRNDANCLDEERNHLMDTNDAVTVLDSGPDISFGFGSDVETDISSILSRSQEDRYLNTPDSSIPGSRRRPLSSQTHNSFNTGTGDIDEIPMSMQTPSAIRKALFDRSDEDKDSNKENIERQNRDYSGAELMDGQSLSSCQQDKQSAFPRHDFQQYQQFSLHETINILLNRETASCNSPDSSSNRELESMDCVEVSAATLTNRSQPMSPKSSSRDNFEPIPSLLSATANSLIDSMPSAPSKSDCLELIPSPSTSSDPGDIPSTLASETTDIISISASDSTDIIPSTLATETAEEIVSLSSTNEVLDSTSESTSQRPNVEKVYKQKESQKKRAKGEAYVGRQYSASTGKYTLVEKAAKNIQARCDCLGRGRQCKEISEEQRREIHDYFWKSLKTWIERKVYIIALVDVHDINTGRKKRRFLKYNLKSNGVKKTVCAKLFLSTLNISDWTVRDWCCNEVRQEMKRSIHYDRNLVQKNYCVEQFLDKLNTMPSHYCRKDTDKNYVERCFRSYEDLHRQYIAQCREDNMKALDIKTFKALFHAHPKKLALFHPRKDQCDTCVEHERGNLDETKWNQHRMKYQSAQEEKAKDKSERDPKTLLISMDLQAVLLSPSMQASALYYRTKLTVHNFTIFDLGTADVECYVWHEVEGGLTANEFCTCLYSYLTNRLTQEEYEKCIIYSDGCTYQNRNKTMAKMLSLIARTHGIVVEQKYLEKGHTQMECDSVHATVEKNLKKNGISCDIYSPSDYIRIISEARKGKDPYKVHYLTYGFFQSFDDVTSLSSLRPGKVSGEPTVVDLRAIRYTRDGEIMFKLHHKDDWEILPRSRSDVKLRTNTPKPLYNGPRKITKEKFNHLQQMKTVLPRDVHAFYDNLPH